MLDVENFVPVLEVTDEEKACRVVSLRGEAFGFWKRRMHVGVLAGKS